MNDNEYSATPAEDKPYKGSKAGRRNPANSSLRDYNGSKQLHLGEDIYTEPSIYIVFRPEGCFPIIAL